MHSLSYLSCDQSVCIQCRRNIVSGKVDGVKSEVVDGVGVEAGVDGDTTGDASAG